MAKYALKGGLVQRTEQTSKMDLRVPPAQLGFLQKAMRIVALVALRVCTKTFLQLPFAKIVLMGFTLQLPFAKFAPLGFCIFEVLGWAS